MKAKNETIFDSLSRATSTLGLPTTVLSAALLIALAVCVVRIGSIPDQKSQGTLTAAVNQQLLLASITNGVLTIRMSIEQEDWGRIEPEYESVSAGMIEYRSTHDRLLQSTMNRSTINDSDYTVAGYFANLQLPLSKFTKSIDEIGTLSQSIIRRAPYIDRDSIDRFAVSLESMESSASTLAPIHAGVTELYRNLIESKRSQAISSALFWCKITGALFLAVVLVGFIPRLSSLARERDGLASQLAAAHKASASRWHFLASMGHAFRTPLTTIMGFASLLSNEEQDKSTRIEYAKTIVGAGDGLLTVIEDVLVMSAIQADEFQLRTSTITLQQLLREIEHLYRPKAEDKGLSFRVLVDDSCPLSVTTDQQRLLQVITKIVGNAIQYTATGSVEVHAGFESSDTQGTLILKVVDTGIGMDKGRISDVFDPFCSLSGSSNRLYAGAGLGLTVAKALAEKLGGGISIDSARGAGSFVTIRIDSGEYIENHAHESLTLHEPRAIEHPIQSNRDVLDGRSILIIEDGQDNQRLLSHHLTKAGCFVQLADDGKAGVDRILESIESGSPFDLILMDMQMPVLDGYEATSTLREDGVTIPIIGVTAYARGGDRERCINTGCSEYLSKPIDRDTLLDLCARIIEQQDLGTGGSVAAAA